MSSHSAATACTTASVLRPPRDFGDPGRRPPEEPAAGPRITKRYPRIRQGLRLRQLPLRGAAPYPRRHGGEKGPAADRQSPQPTGGGDGAGSGGTRGR